MHHHRYFVIFALFAWLGTYEIRAEFEAIDSANLYAVFNELEAIYLQNDLDNQRWDDVLDDWDGGWGSYSPFAHTVFELRNLTNILQRSADYLQTITNTQAESVSLLHGVTNLLSMMTNNSSGITDTNTYRLLSNIFLALRYISPASEIGETNDGWNRIWWANIYSDFDWNTNYYNLPKNAGRTPVSWNRIFSNYWERLLSNTSTGGITPILQSQSVMVSNMLSVTDTNEIDYSDEDWEGGEMSADDVWEQWTGTFYNFSNQAQSAFDESATMTNVFEQLHKDLTTTFIDDFIEFLQQSLEQVLPINLGKSSSVTLDFIPTINGGTITLDWSNVDSKVRILRSIILGFLAWWFSFTIYGMLVETFTV